MTSQNHYALAKFGIDEIYIYKGFSSDLLEKLHQRAAFGLDGEDNIVSKYVTHDMILIFHKRVPSQSLIYRFVQFLDQDKNKDDFIESNTLLNEDELFPAIKSKNFVLVTPKILLNPTCAPKS